MRRPCVRDELRKRNYLPVLFDFDKPASKDLTGTVQTLANMARFIIADLTEPSSVPHELAMVIPTTVVPVRPILLVGQGEYAMFIDLKRPGATHEKSLEDQAVHVGIIPSRIAHVCPVPLLHSLPPRGKDGYGAIGNFSDTFYGRTVSWCLNSTTSRRSTKVSEGKLTRYEVLPV